MSKCHEVQCAQCWEVISGPTFFIAVSLDANTYICEGCATQAKPDGKSNDGDVVFNRATFFHGSSGAYQLGAPAFSLTADEFAKQFAIANAVQ